MPTYRAAETFVIDAPLARVDAAFLDFWQSALGRPLARPFVGGTPERRALGVFHQSKGGKRDRVDTTVTLTPRGSLTEVRYERAWTPPLPIGLIGHRIARRAWNSLFRTWNDALAGYLGSRESPPR